MNRFLKSTLSLLLALFMLIPYGTGIATAEDNDFSDEDPGYTIVIDDGEDVVTVDKGNLEPDAGNGLSLVITEFEIPVDEETEDQLPSFTMSVNAGTADDDIDFPKYLNAKINDSETWMKVRVDKWEQIDAEYSVHDGYVAYAPTFKDSMYSVKEGIKIPYGIVEFVEDNNEEVADPTEDPTVPAASETPSDDNEPDPTDTPTATPDPAVDETETPAPDTTEEPANDPVETPEPSEAPEVPDETTEPSDDHDQTDPDNDGDDENDDPEKIDLGDIVPIKPIGGDFGVSDEIKANGDATYQSNENAVMGLPASYFSGSYPGHCVNGTTGDPIDWAVSTYMDVWVPWATNTWSTVISSGKKYNLVILFPGGSTTQDPTIWTQQSQSVRNLGTGSDGSLTGAKLFGKLTSKGKYPANTIFVSVYNPSQTNLLKCVKKLIEKGYPIYASGSTDAAVKTSMKNNACHFVLAGYSLGAKAAMDIYKSMQGCIGNYVIMSLGSTSKAESFSMTQNSYGKPQHLIVSCGAVEEATATWSGGDQNYDYTNTNKKHIAKMAPYAMDALYIKYAGAGTGHNWSVWFTSLYTAGDFVCAYDALGSIALFKDSANALATSWDTGAGATEGTGTYYSVRGAVYQLQKKTQTYPSTVDTTLSLYGGGTLEFTTGNKYTIDSQGNSSAATTLSDPRKIQILNLLPGTYRYREITASKGFSKTSGWKEITVLEGKTTTHGGASEGGSASQNENNVAKLQEPPKLGSLKITKKSFRPTTTNNSNGNGSFSLANGKYEIHHEAISDANLAKVVYGSSTSNTKVELVTDASGEATVSNLPFGTYTIVETQAPDGFLNASGPSGTITGTFTINSTTQKNLTSSAVSILADEPNAVLINLSGKTYNNTNFGIPTGSKAGATYAFYKLTSRTDTIYTSAKMVGTITTDANGASTGPITLMCDGSWYAMKEMLPPSSGEYLISSEVYKFKPQSAWDSTNSEWTWSLLEYNQTTTRTSNNNVFTITANWTPALQEPVNFGNLSIHKVDAITGSSLQGAVYGLYTSSACTTLVTGLSTNNVDNTNTVKLQTDASGNASYVGISPGLYYLKEITPPSGYIANTNYYLVSITAQQTVTLSGSSGTNGTYSFYNVAILKDTPVTGNISIHKVDTTTGSAVQGAVYGVYTTSACTTLVTGLSLNSVDNTNAVKLQTDSSGNASYNGIAPGTYYLKEITAPSGYTLNTNYYQFTITAQQTTTLSGSSGTNGTYSFYNVAILKDAPEGGSLEITKVDAANTSTKVAGAVYGIYLDSTCNTLVQQMPATGNDGKSTVTGLPVGMYYLKEITPPAGYHANTEVYPFTIASGQTTQLSGATGINNSTYAFYNVSALQDVSNLVSVGINGKTYENITYGIPTGSKAGAVYTFYKLTSKTDTSYTAAKVVGTITTDANGDGTSMVSLESGYWYAMKETQAPTSGEYSVSTTVYKFTPVATYNNGAWEYSLLESNETTTRTPDTGTDNQFTILNAWTSALKEPVNYGNLIIKKVDADDKTTYVPNAVYGVYTDAQCTTLATGLSTNNVDGTNTVMLKTASISVTYRGIAPGTYYLKEISTAPGYALNTNVQTFTITARKNTYLYGTEGTNTSTTTYDVAALQDQKAHYYIDKVTFYTNASLSGASLQIKNGNTVVESWTSDGTPHEIQATLQHNVTYTLHEVSAPTGYYESEDVSFHIRNDGKMYKGQAGAGSAVANNTIRFVNYPLNDVVIIKQSSVPGDTSSMAGAQFSIYNADTNTLVTTVTTVAGPYANLPSEISITGTYGYATFSLKPGNYYMVETAAPAGFQLASPNRVDFTIYQQAPSGVSAANTSDAWDFGHCDYTDSQNNEEYYTLYMRPFFIIPGSTEGLIASEYDFSGILTLSVRPTESTRGGTSYTIFARDAYGMTTPFLSEVPAVGGVEITKVDALNTATTLAGAVYGIYSDAACNTLVQQMPATGSNGKSTFSGLTQGTYYLKEITPPTGYAPNTSIQQFTVAPDATTHLYGAPGTNTTNSIYNVEALKDAPNSVIVGINGKTYANTTYGTPTASMAGAVYTFYKLNSRTDTSYTAAKVVGTITTDANGNGTSTVTLECGYWYAMKETQAPTSGEYAVSTNVYKFIPSVAYNNGTWEYSLLEYDQTTTRTPDTGTDRQFTILNTWTTALKEPVNRAKLQIYKVDATDSTVKVANAVYGVYTDAQCTTLATGLTANNVDGTYEIKMKTNSSGYCQYTGIAPGTYYLKEISSPAGYSLNPNVYQFTISVRTTQKLYGMEGTDTTTVLYGIDALQDWPRGSLEITKVDALNPSTTLAGAVYGIYSDSTCNTLVQQMSATGNNGKATATGLDRGTYYLKEITPPTGYHTNTNVYQFTITAGQTTTLSGAAGTDGTYSFYNIAALKDAPNAVHVGINGKTYSNTTYGTPTGSKAGAVYTFYKLNSKTDTSYTSAKIVGTITTDANGNGTGMVTLESGYWYAMKETQAPTSGEYLVSSTVYKFSPIAAYNSSNNTWSYTLEQENGTIRSADANTTDQFTILNTWTNALKEPVNYGNLTIIKVDADDKTIKVPNAIYGVYTNSGCTTLATGLSTNNVDGTNTVKLKTDSSGSASYIGLAPGTYYLKEISTPDEYLINTNVYQFTITAQQTTLLSGATGTNGTYSFYNLAALQDAKGHYYADKKASDTGLGQSGASLQIKQGNTVIESWTSNGTPHEIQTTLQRNVTYTLHEVSAPAGYTVASDMTFYIGDDGYMYSGAAGGSGGVISNATIVMQNAPILIGGITVSKTAQQPRTVTTTTENGLNGSTYTVTHINYVNVAQSGATIGLYQAGASGNSTDIVYNSTTYHLVDSQVTNASGQASFANVPVGTYLLKEIAAPAGYVVNTSWAQIVTITGVNNSASASVTNTPIKTNISFVKYMQTMTPVTDSSTGTVTPTYSYVTAPLNSGFLFGLYNRNAITVNGTTVAAGTLLGIASPDANGKVEFDMYLPQGTYYVKELECPSGYFLSTTEYDVTNVGATATGTNYILHPNNNRINNDLLGSRLRLLKRWRLSSDTSSYGPLQGAGFEVKDSNNVVVAKGYTDANGYFVASLPNGTYTVHEFYTPAGHLPVNDFTWTVNSSAVIPTTTITSTTTKYDYKTLVNIVKVDGNGDGLVGAVLQVKQGNTVIDQWTSDGTNHVIEGDLDPEVIYTLHEVSAPAGYAVAPDITFKIKNNGNVYIVVGNTETSQIGRLIAMTDQPDVAKIIKVDANNNPIQVAGITFDIKTASGTLIESVTTNANGEATLTGIYDPSVDYRVYETSAPSGYVLPASGTYTTMRLSNCTYTTDANGIKTYQVKIQNTKIMGQITVAKTGSQPDNVTTSTENGLSNATYTVTHINYVTKGLAGAVIGLYQAGSSGNSTDITYGGTTYHLVTSGTTNSSGQITFGNLELGTYLVREISAPTGYTVNTTGNTVTLSQGNQSSALITATSALTNTAIKTNVSFVKYIQEMHPVTDPETGLVSPDYSTYVVAGEGFLFGLYNRDAMTVNGTTIAANTLLAIAATDANGHVEFEEYLPNARYYVQELEAATGYYKATTKYYITTVGATTSTDTYVLYANNNSVNNKLNGRPFRIVKKSRNRGDTSIYVPLAGAGFEVYDSNNVLVVKGYTDADGYLLCQLPNGTYTVHEFYTPPGHLPIADFTQTVSSSAYIAETDTHVVNASTKYDYKTYVNIKKVDGSGSPLSGAVLQIKQGNTVIDQWTTDGTDHVIEGVLEPGVTYTLHEVSAPSGYTVASDMTFTINNNANGYIVMNGATISNRTITVYNYSGASMPASGSSEALVTACIGAMTTILGLMFIIVSSKKKRRINERM